MNPTRSSARPWWALSAGVLGLLVGGLAVALVDREAREPLGAWIAGFITTSGFAGLCAVLAAGLALIGISHQMWVARRGQQHQSEADQDAAWWQRFEWVASRAVPAGRDEVPLPFEAVSSTLTALTRSARDDVQRAAVGAMMDVAGQERPRQHESDQSVTGNEARLRESLQAYSSAAGTSPARSAVAEARLYELDVFDALRRVAGGENVQTEVRLPRDKEGRSVTIVDAILDYRDRHVLAEVAFRSTAGPFSGQKLLQVKRLEDSSGGRKDFCELL